MSETATTYNNYLRVAAHIATLILIPVLVYFNSKLNENQIRLTAIETKMDTRSMMREAQLSSISVLLQDHETRIRILEASKKEVK